MKSKKKDHSRSNDGDHPEPSDMNAISSVSFPAASPMSEVTNFSDVALLRQWKNGDIQGYNSLVKRYERPLLVFIFKTIRDDFDAKDVLQETFVRLHRSLDKLKEDKSLKSWLYTTANNLSIDYLRKRKPGKVTAMDHQDTTFQALADASDIEGPQRPDDKMSETVMQEKILEAIETLPKQQRMAMTLRSVKGFSLREIADVMNSTEQTVGTTLFAARKKLMKTLQPILEEEYGPISI